MNKKLMLYFIIAGLFIGVLTAGILTQFGKVTNDPLTFKTINGDTINFETRQEDVIILYFFRLTCSSCKITDPLIAAIDRDYNETELLIITITIDPADSEVNLNAWKADLNATWEIVKDGITNTYSSAFNVAFTPTTLIYNHDRNLAARFEGTGDFDTLVRITLENLLNA